MGQISSAITEDHGLSTAISSTRVSLKLEFLSPTRYAKTGISCTRRIYLNQCGLCDLFINLLTVVGFNTLRPVQNCQSFKYDIWNAFPYKKNVLYLKYTHGTHYNHKCYYLKQCWFITNETEQNNIIDNSTSPKKDTSTQKYPIYHHLHACSLLWGCNFYVG